MRKRAGYLTKKKGGYGPKDTQSIVENNSKITKLAVCKKSKQFLKSIINSKRGPIRFLVTERHCETTMGQLATGNDSEAAFDIRISGSRLHQAV